MLPLHPAAAAIRQAFRDASGISDTALALVLGLILGALVFMWAGNAARTMLAQLMHEPALMARNGMLVIRAMIIVMVIVYVLS